MLDLKDQEASPVVFDGNWVSTADSLIACLENGNEKERLYAAELVRSLCSIVDNFGKDGQPFYFAKGSAH